ncbi:MAG: glycosyltransferase [Clostridia bacterium]|nr:glycosyltransferase [Clostridia bacterium]
MNNSAGQAERKISVLVIYAGLIPSVEISVLIPLRYLAQQGKIDLVAGAAGELNLKAVLPQCDLVVFSRCCMPHEYIVLDYVRQLNIPYVYDIDDNFFRLAEAKEPTQMFLQQEGVLDNLRAFISYAQLVKTGSEQLRQDMQAYNRNIVIHPYVFDFELISERTPFSKDEEGKIVIGYAGSLVHSKDLKNITDALASIARKYAPRVRFEFYGAKPEQSGKLDPKLLEISTFIRYQPDYASFIRDVSGRGWDIALAPLADNIANRSKTNNKYREYAACGIAGVYSNMPVYQSCVVDGENGMLADYTCQSWTEKIEELICNEELRKRITSNAYLDVRKNNHIDAVARKWYEDIILPYALDKKRYSIELRKKQLRKLRTVYTLRQYVNMSGKGKLQLLIIGIKSLAKKMLREKGVKK